MDSKRSADPAQRARPSEYFDLGNFDKFKSGRQYYIIRNAKPEREAGERPARTVVVLGTGRSGTTMAAGVLRILGEELGDRLNWYLEDHDIRDCLLSVYRSFLFWKVIPLRWRFSKIMKDRHRRWKRWTFKSPYLPAFIMLLSGAIPNAYYIIPTRNLLETSFGLHEYLYGGWRTSMLTGILQQVFLTLFCMATRRPVMLFSYDAVINNDPGFFVDVLADFLSIDVDVTRKQAAIEYIDPARGYASAPGIRANIDRLSNSEIRGWVVDTRMPGRSVMLTISAGDKLLATVRAGKKRLDVRDAGYHQTGLCGFRVFFNEPLRDEEFKNVRLTDAETNESVLTQ